MVKFSMPTGSGGEQIFTPEGPSIRRSRGGGRSRKPKKPAATSTEERNKVFADFRAGRITQSQAIGKISGAGARDSFQSRLTAESERRQQENQRQRQEAETARQEKIQSGRIGGQLAAPVIGAGFDFGQSTRTDIGRDDFKFSDRRGLALPDIGAGRDFGQGTATGSGIGLSSIIAPGSTDTTEEDPFRIGLSEREKSMRTSDVIKGRFSEVGSGIISASGKLQEATASLFLSSFGFQKLEFDKEGKRVGTTIEFPEESFVGRQIDKPLSTGKLLGEGLVFAPIIGGAVTEFGLATAQRGISTALTEGISGLSPIRLKSKSFGALEGLGGKDLKFDVVSFKQVKGDTTARVVVGKGQEFDDVFLLSKQVSRKVNGKDVSFSSTDITAPKTTFEGGRPVEGFRSIRSESIDLGTGGGQASLKQDFGKFSSAKDLGISGSGSKVVTRTKSNLEFDEFGGVNLDINFGAQNFGTPKTTGALSKAGDDFTLFGAGRGREILKIDKSSISKKVRIEDFNIRGFEFDIPATTTKDTLGSLTTGKGVKGFGSGGKGVQGFDNSKGLETSAKQISSSISDISSSSLSKGRTLSSIRSGGVFGLPSVFTGTGQFEKTGGGLVPGFKQDIKTNVVLKDTPVIDFGSDVKLDVKFDLGSIQRTGSRGRRKSRPDQFLFSDFKPDVALDVDTRQLQESVTTQKTIQPLKTTQQQTGFEGDPFFGAPRSPTRPRPSGGLPGFALFPTFKAGKKPSRRVGKRKPGRIGTSLTGEFLFSTQGITGFLPETQDLGVLGITPGRTRLRQRPKKKIKRKKK